MSKLVILIICLTFLTFCYSFQHPRISCFSSRCVNTSVMKAVAADKDAANNDKPRAILKPELVNQIYEKIGGEVSKVKIDAIICALGSVVKEQVLIEGKEIRIKDIGTFKPKLYAARTGRNPQSGEAIQISSSKSVAFVASTNYKMKE